MLGPVLERLQNELIDPLIALTFAAIDEAGLVPPPPDELQGQPLNVVLLSILAQAQKAVGVNSIDRFVAAGSSVSQVKPEGLDVFDADARPRNPSPVLSNRKLSASAFRFSV
mgnify:CR=1 FL=1